MGILLARRLVNLILTFLVTTFLTFLILESNPDGVARKALGQFATEEQREEWLVQENYYRGGIAPELSDDIKTNWINKGYTPRSEQWVADWEENYDVERIADDNLLIVRNRDDGTPVQESAVLRYFDWFGRIIVGDFGYSYRFKEEVSEILWPRLGSTLILMGLTMVIMVPLALALGFLAGVREGTLQDRFFSFVSITTTSVPEFASAVLLSAIFVFWLKLLPGVSIQVGDEGINFTQLILPVSVLVLYGAGYISRISRASMADVMRSHYIRTAFLKGLPRTQVVTRHAIRNAMITPVTVIMLQIPWLLNGVIVVEYFFAIKGFGSLVWEAAQTQDPFLLEACVIISVFVVVSTQLIADICYTYLNPKIRFQ